MGDNNMVVRGNWIRFLLSSMFSSRIFLAGFLATADVVSMMYYNTMLNSHLRFPVWQTPHEITISIILGIDVALAVAANIYVMKTVMRGGEEVMKAATRTAMSMAAGACACVGSFASMFISLGIGAGAGFLALLSANLPVFFPAAGIIGFISIILAANTLSNVSHLLKGSCPSEVR